jgi:prevent-host-death family protein
MAKVIPLTEARATLSELLDQIEDGGEHVVITRKGRPVALMLSPDEWESVELTLETLGDTELLDQLERSERDVEAGRLVGWEAVRGRYIRD